MDGLQYTKDRDMVDKEFDLRCTEKVLTTEWWFVGLWLLLQHGATGRQRLKREVRI